MRIEVWADYVCPWCYLAIDRVRYLESEHDATVVWHPFELHPEVPPGGAPAPRGRTTREVRSELRSDLEEAGLPIVRRTRISNSARALALSAWATDGEHWPALHRALYDAYWTEDLDLGDPETLVDIAARAGIDRTAASDAVAEGAGREAVRAARERALDLGIGGTPGWHFGNGVVLVGAHPPEVFDRVIARLT